MKNLIKYASLTALITVIICYLYGAFKTWHLNPEVWGDSTRNEISTYAFWLVLSIIVIAAILEIKRNNN